MYDENAATTLIEELSHDDELEESERAALWRVRRRLELQVAPVQGPFAVRRSRWALGARAGLAAGLLFGTALGAGGHALVSALWATSPSPAPPSVPAASAKRASMAPSAAPTSASAPAPVQEPAVEPAPPARAAARSTSSSATPRSIEQELRELEAARRALRDGDAERALRLLEAHAALHKASALAQERDALRIKALVGAGQHAAARNAADAFAARYPSSLLLDSVRRAVASIP